MDPNQVPPNLAPPPNQAAPPANQPNPVPPPPAGPVVPPPPPAPAPTGPPPKGSNKTLIIILAVIGGVVILILLLVVLMFAFSGGQSSKKSTEPTSSNTTTSSAEPTLPSGYVPINTACYRVAAPTNNSLDNDSACYVHVDYGANKSGGYMIAELTGNDNASSVTSWKKSNTYKIVSEENIKVDGFDGVKIVYSRPVGSKTVKGVIVFVATPTKKYMDGTFNIPGFEASSASYVNDDNNSMEVFDTLINTWHWK